MDHGIGYRYINDDCCTLMILNYVDGVQGRYFIPFIGLLLVTLIPKKKCEFKIDKNDI